MLISRWRLIAFCLAFIIAMAVGFSVWTASPLSSGANASTPPTPVAERVVFVGAAGLRWEDVSTQHTPTIASLVRKGSAATLSVRSASIITCPAEGWLTVGAGNYATLHDPAENDDAENCQKRMPPPVSDVNPHVPSMPAIALVNDAERFDARPGLLGEKLSCTSAVGPGAALAAASPQGYIAHYEPTLPTDSSMLFRKCPFTAVDLGEVRGTGEERAAGVRAVEQSLARVVENLPKKTVLIFAGVSETETVQAYLHVAVIQGPTFGAGWLHSPSTRRLPYVQLADIAPTVLQVLGIEEPSSLAGQPLDGGVSGRPGSLKGTIAALTDTNTQAVAQRSTISTFFVVLGILLLIVVGGLVWLLYRRGRGESTSDGAIRWLSVAALGLATVPTASYLANLVPWWRSSSPTLMVWAIVVCVGLVMLAFILVGASIKWGGADVSWEQRTRIRICLLTALTVTLFVVDAMTGAKLQLNSMFGYNPLVAGRFAGFGNPAFSVFAVSGILLAAFLAYGFRRLVALSLWAVVAVTVIAIDGFPRWGADFGGVLTLVPSFVVLALMLTRTPITWQKVGGASLAGFGIVMVIGWLDYLRPPSDRSHFGRFVGSIADGSAINSVVRKLRANWELLFDGPHTIAAMVGIILAVIVIFRPTPGLRQTYDTWPVVRMALVAVCFLAGFAFLTNDSGIAIPTIMSLVVLPLVAAMCAWVAVGDPFHRGPHQADKQRVRTSGT